MNKSILFSLLFLSLLLSPVANASLIGSPEPTGPTADNYMLPDDSFSHPISTLDSDELDNLDSNNTIGNIFSVGDELVEVTIETNADTTTAQGGGDVSFEVEILPWLHEAGLTK